MNRGWCTWQTVADSFEGSPPPPMAYALNSTAQSEVQINGLVTSFGSFLVAVKALHACGLSIVTIDTARLLHIPCWHTGNSHIGSSDRFPNVENRECSASSVPPSILEPRNSSSHVLLQNNATAFSGFSILMAFPSSLFFVAPTIFLSRWTLPFYGCHAHPSRAVSAGLNLIPFTSRVCRGFRAAPLAR